MSFSAALTCRTVFGNRRAHLGTWGQASGDTGGVINTGLQRIEELLVSSPEMVSQAFSGGAATIVTKDPAATQNGNWMAIGY